MVSQGRCSARQIRTLLLATLLIIACLFSQSPTTSAASFTVGDKSGWTFGVAGWPKGKRFKTGDVLVFKYSSSVHNVVAVDVNGYKNCSASSSRSNVYQSGSDSLKLVKGMNYFICGIPGHCASGLKLAVNAS